MDRIDSRENKRFRHLLRLKEESRYRQETGTLLIEGKNLIFDLPDAYKGTLYTTVPCGLSGWDEVLIHEKLAKKLSDTLHPETLFAEVPMPQESSAFNPPLVAFDAVSDPGNLGTLLRTAAAFGFGGALFLPGCCDPFNPKAMRASKGALFSLPYRRISFAELKILVKEMALSVLAADTKGAPPESVQGNRNLLILGNEGKGVSPESKNLGIAVSLPMQGKMESLNVAVAGGILMYLLQGKR